MAYLPSVVLNDASEITSGEFSVQTLLTDILPQLPLSQTYVGCQATGSTEVLQEPFPAQWQELCRRARRPARLESQPWWNNKFSRKEHWHRLGVPTEYLVPTWYYTRTYSRHKPKRRGSTQQSSDEDVPCMPEDLYCSEALQEALRKYHSFVIKPSEGNRAEGVMHVTAEEDGEVALRAHTAEVELMEAGPVRVAFEEFYHRHLLLNEHFQASSGFLVEPAISWNNEVTCMSVAGGRLIVVGSKGAGLVRSPFAEAVCLQGHRPVDPMVIALDAPPIVVKYGEGEEEQRATYQLSTPHIAQGSSTTPSSMLLTLKDDSGRHLWEVIRDVTRTLTHDVSITRVDFFVHYENRNIFLNEVEHGFSAALLPSWFGMQMTELICKAWLLSEASSSERMLFEARGPL